MKIFLIVLVSLMLLAGFSSVSWAVTVSFNQSTGFDTTLGTLLSNQSGGTVLTNDIRWNTTVPAVPSDLPSGYSIVSPSSPYFNTITWGVANDQGGLDSDHWGDTDYSGLRVLGFAGNNTVGDWSIISRIYHQNSAIDDSLAVLSSDIITSTLTVGTADLNSIPFTFHETLNSGPKVGPVGLGNWPDYWTFDPVGFVPVSFTYGGTDYLAEFQLVNLHDSDLVMNSGSSWSLWTAEDTTSSADVQMRLTAVPEPASLSLLGLGLLGLVFKKKRIV